MKKNTVIVSTLIQNECSTESEQFDEADVLSWEDISLSDLETDYVEIEEIEEGEEEEN